MKECFAVVSYSAVSINVDFPDLVQLNEKLDTKENRLNQFDFMLDSLFICVYENILEHKEGGKTANVKNNRIRKIFCCNKLPFKVV
jgi:hypothetical protein